MGRHTIKQEDTHPTPATGYVSIYPKTDGNVYKKDDTGTESPISEGSTPGEHSALHESGGAQEIDVTGLSGVLADRQDANKILGIDVEFDHPTPDPWRKLAYNAIENRFEYEHLPSIPYARVWNRDWSPTKQDIEEHGHFLIFNTTISLTGLVGNASVSTINGISPTPGDVYVVTDTGTLTLGSVAVSAGSVVVYNGSIWVQAIPPDPVSGGVLADIRVRLSTTTALISPYTDGVDDGKLVAYDGGSVIGTVLDSDDIVFTLPDPADWPVGNGAIYGIMECGNLGGDADLIVKVAGGELFSDGLTEYHMPNDSESIGLAVASGYLKQTWIRTRTNRALLQTRRAATWASTNFATEAAIPFDTVDQSTNSAVAEWTSGNATRITAKVAGYVDFDGHLAIDSTGGSTYTVEAWLRKNGTTEIPGTRLRTGNYQNEDQSLTLQATSIWMEKDDYIEWMIDHASLTGNLNSAVLSAKRDI